MANTGCGGSPEKRAPVDRRRRQHHRTITLTAHRSRADDHDIAELTQQVEDHRSASPPSPPDTPSIVAAPSTLETKFTLSQGLERSARA
jgi:hypothetical protein